MTGKTREPKTPNEWANFIAQEYGCIHGTETLPEIITRIIEEALPITVCDPRIAAIALFLHEVIGPSPVEVPFGYDAITVAEGCVKAADLASRKHYHDDYIRKENR